MPKMPQLQDFQFFNTTRITQLYEKQHAYEVFMHEKKKEMADKVPFSIRNLRLLYWLSVQKYPADHLKAFVSFHSTLLRLLQI